MTKFKIAWVKKGQSKLTKTIVPAEDEIEAVIILKRQRDVESIIGVSEVPNVNN